MIRIAAAVDARTSEQRSQVGGDGTGSSSGPATTSSSSGPESSRKGLASGPPAPPRVDDTGHAMTAPLIVPKLRAPAKIVDTVLPTSCLEWALQHCERWLHMRDNEDIDWPDQNVRPSLCLHLIFSPAVFKHSLVL